MFSSPDIEAELSATVRKRRHETQLITFNKLQALASNKLVQLDKFIGLQVYVRYELFLEKVKGIKFSHLLYQGQGPTPEGPSTSAPSVPRKPQYKSIEGFLDFHRKHMPWLTVRQAASCGSKTSPWLIFTTLN